MKRLRQSLPLQIFLGMALGIVVGGIFGKDVQGLKMLGDIFLRLLQMLVVPFVFTVLLTGTASIGNPKDLGRVGVKVLLMYELTSIIAIAVSLSVALAIQPGLGLPKLEGAPPKPPVAMDFKDLFMTFIPSNPFDAAARGDMMQLIIFSLFFGVALGMIKNRVPVVLQVLEQVNDGLISLVGIVMKLAPFGVFGLMTWTMSTYGLPVLIPLAKYLIGIAISITFQTFIVSGFLVWLFTRLNPVTFFKHCWEAMVVAFTTCSSAASLPLQFKAAQQNLGIEKRVWAFTLPLGSMNQDGTAMYQAMAAVLIAEFYGVELSFGKLFVILMTALLASSGTFAVPGAGLITLAIVLRSAGLPLEGIALVAGVDRIADMFRTTLNVLDDLSVTTIVAHWENGLNRKIFYGEETASGTPVTETPVS
jgi:Na+/H+-dicarboxylate symporter